MAYNAFERRVNARKQLRGKDGKWIFMGGSVKWLDKATGALTSGRVKGISGDYVNIDGTDGQTYTVHRSAITSIPAKAHIPTTGPDLLKVTVAKQDGAVELRVGNNHTITPNKLKVGDRVYGGSSTNPNNPPSWAAKTGQAWYSQVTNGDVWEVVSIEEKPADRNITYKNAAGIQKDVLTPKSPGIRLIPENDQLNEGINNSIQDLITDDEQQITDVSDWAIIKTGLGGSNGAALYENVDTGETYVVKFPKSELHARNEVLASRLYAAAGVPSPSSELVTKDGKIGVATAYIPNADTLASKLDNEEFINKLREGYAVDAWLANWDVTGLEYDNVLSDENNDPIRIDPGGALLFRAQGAPKGQAFGPEAGEWDTLKQGNEANKVFGSITDEQRNASAALLKDISDSEINELVESVGFDQEEESFLKSTLIARRDDILSRAGTKAELPAIDTLPEEMPTDRVGIISWHVYNKNGTAHSNVTSFVNSAKTKALPKGEPISFGDIAVSMSTGNAKSLVLISKLKEEDGVEFWSAIPSGISSKYQKSSPDTVQVRIDSTVGVYRPYEIKGIPLPDVEKTSESTGMFTPLADPGVSGDGYHESGPWGKFGAAGLMIRDSDTKEFLIVQRGPDTSNHKGKWQLPGGALDSNENPYQGSAREAIEELKMPQEYLDSLTHKGDVVFDNQEGWTYTNIAVETDKDFVPTIDGTETGDYRWVTGDELKVMKEEGSLVPAFANNVDDLLALYGSTEDSKNSKDIPVADIEKKVYSLEEIDSAVKDFLNNNGSDGVQIKYFDIEGGSGVLVDTGADSDAVIFYPNTDTGTNATEISRDEALNQDLYLILDDLLFGGEAQDPTEIPRLSASSVDLDALPEGSVVKFASATDSKVYVKDSDGTWEASWLSEGHSKKTVTSDNIHAVAAYLGEDVQIVKDDSAPEPVVDVVAVEESTADQLEALPADTLVELKPEDGDKSYTAKKLPTGGFIIKQYGTDEYGTPWSTKSLLNILGPDTTFRLLPPEPEPEPEEESNDPEPKTSGLTVSIETLDRLPVGTKAFFTDSYYGFQNGPFTKDEDGTWSKPYNDGSPGKKYPAETIENAYPNFPITFVPLTEADVVKEKEKPDVEELADWEKELLNGTTDTKVSQLQQDLIDLAPGTKIKFTGSRLVYTKSDGIELIGPSGLKYHPADLDMSFDIVPENVDISDAPATPIHPENPEIVMVLDGINIDEDGNQWVPDKEGKPLYVGDVVVSKVGEAGKITFIQKGGAKVRVTTSEGDTKFWGIHLVTKGDESLLTESDYVYQVNTDSNGTEFVTTKNGVNIYVGDTVKSPGKAGFEGVVTGIVPSGQFVLVEDPETGKSKPRKIDKIEVTSSSYVAPVEEPTVTPETTTEEQIGEMPSGQQIHVKMVGSTNEGSIFTKDTDDHWISENSGLSYTDSEMYEYFEDNDFETTVLTPSVPYLPGEDVTDLKQLEDAPDGTKIVLGSDPESTVSYIKENGKWSADGTGNSYTSDTFKDIIKVDTLSLKFDGVKEEPDNTPVNVTSTQQMEDAPEGSTVLVEGGYGSPSTYTKVKGKWALPGDEDVDYMLESKNFVGVIKNQSFTLTLNQPNTSETSEPTPIDVTTIKQLEDAPIGSSIDVVFEDNSSGTIYNKEEKGWVNSKDPDNIKYYLNSSDFSGVVSMDNYKVTFVSGGAKATTPEEPSTPTPAPPVELPKDESSPWYGVDEPTAPEVPENVSSSKYLPESWVDEAKKTYLELKGKELTSSGYWPQMEGLISLGDTSLPSTAKIEQYGPQEDRFDFFAVRGFIAPEQAIEGRKLLEERKKKIQEDLQIYTDAKEKYNTDLNEWRTANGIPLKGLNPATFQLSGAGTKFDSATAGEAWADKNLPTAVGLLTPEEIGAVQAWTTVGGNNGHMPNTPWKSFSIALRSGKQKVYEDINTLNDPQMIEMAKNLDSAIAKSEVPETFTTIRNADYMNFNATDGTTITNYAQLAGQVDSIVTDYGFIASSASSSPGYGGGGGVVIEITIPKGANALWLSGKNSDNAGKNSLGAKPEYEVLLPRGTKLYIHEVTSGAYGKTYVKAEIVPDNWTPPVGVTSGPVSEVESGPNGPIASVDDSVLV